MKIYVLREKIVQPKNRLNGGNNEKRIKNKVKQT